MSKQTSKTGLSNILGNDINPATEDKQGSVDALTNSIQVISYPHHEIHSGSSFGCENFADLGNGDVLDVQIVTPDITKWAHMTFQFFGSVEFEWFLYEGVTINTTGTTGPVINHNRNSLTPNTTTVAAIENTSVVLANSDTDATVDGVVTIIHGKTGANRDEGSFNHDDEFIFKRNTAYSLRFIAGSAGYLDYHLNWYEHISKN